MFIRSERLFLRPAWAEDWHDLVDAIAEGAIPGDGGNSPLLLAAEHARHYLAPEQTPFQPRLLITLPGSSGATIIGGCELVLIDGEVHAFCCIRPNYRGQGFAREAARAIKQIARSLGHVHVGDFDGGEPALPRAA